MAERRRIPREEMGPIRKALDSGGKLNTAVDVVSVPAAYLLWGVGAASVAAIGLLAGIHIRKEYIQKTSKPPIDMKPGKEYALAA